MLLVNFYTKKCAVLRTKSYPCICVFSCVLAARPMVQRVECLIMHGQLVAWSHRMDLGCTQAQDELDLA